MRLTTRGRYAVTAILDLALHAEAGPITLADISARQDISLAYLEQLFAKLRKAELVRSSRGPGGGYQLARKPDQVSVAEIITAVDESVDATRCGGARNCHGESRCLTHDLWEDLSQAIGSFLSAVTLEDLIARRMREGAGLAVVQFNRALSRGSDHQLQGVES
jgi:Rrf2 family transcriptional regulator, iron-sulfur cluster assembly transcription factor